MYISKTMTVFVGAAVLMTGVVAGSFFSSGSVPFVSAEYNEQEINQMNLEEMKRAELKMQLRSEEQAKMEARAEAKKIDTSTLDQIYQASFGRPADEDGKRFHVGKDFNQVLNDINNSPERRYYSALFKSVKAYEEAVRAPGDLSAADKQKYLDGINSALSTLLAWVETLPEQNICRGIIGILEARQSIQDAYDKMSPEAKAAAQKGVFHALESLPKDLPLPLQRCLTAVTPTPSPL